MSQTLSYIYLFLFVLFHSRTIVSLQADDYCDFVKVDGRDLDTQRFQAEYRKKQKPVVLQHLIDDWLTTRWSKKEVMERFGQTPIKSNDVDDGTIQARDSAGRLGFQDTTVGNIIEDMHLPRRPMYFIRRHHPIVQAIQEDLAVPAVVEPMKGSGPYLSFGGLNSSVNMHQHHENWLANVAGRKLWVVFPSNHTPPAWAWQNSACELASKGLRPTHSCVVHSRELIYLPDSWHHATCNLDAWTLAVGYIGSFDLHPPAHSMAGEGNSARLLEQLVLSNGSDMSLEDRDGMQPLHHAALRGHAAAVDMLAKQKADLFANGLKDGEHPIHLAAALGHTAVLELLVEHRGDVLATDKHGRQPIHFSAKYGSIVDLEWLVMQGTSIAAVNRIDNSQPMHVAAISGHVSVVEWLAEHRGSISAGGKAGGQPMHVAALHGHVPIIEVLRDLGATSDTPLPKDGNQPMHLAAQDGHVAAIDEFLADEDASTEAVNQEGQEPLHVAALFGHAPVVELLLDQRVNVAALARHGAQPLHFAAKGGCAEVVQLLVYWRASISAATNVGGQPILLAAQQGHVLVVKELLGQRASVEAAEPQNMSPIIVASIFGHVPVVQMLASQGVMKRSRDESIKQALQYAKRKGHVAVVQVLETQQRMEL
eukprot:gnl/MRDRNA2_/MRDRNA2_109071_c0_seq1.p1 gnl/MRDRNA2_/MRDRNA2_109071_c0~~gnl/MRDRNA2_/MRDRNA2_109071_c0_seq1.p1  ORF type:complete len:650 (-),score=125.80 gnl/MRDRNA2_/MRDRNA2_109071_c0_seq1:150-2099(-)